MSFKITDNNKTQSNETQSNKSQNKSIELKRLKQLNEPCAYWGFSKYQYNGKNSEGNRFIKNEDL